jgi:hypothetical protein
MVRGALAVTGLLAVLAGAQAQPPAASAADAGVCEPPPGAGQRLTAGGVQAWWRAEPSPLRVGQPFALVVTLCPAQARLLRVDAQMPEHRHGMNYRPTLQPLGAGRWRAEGLLWHMPGRWELLLEAGFGEEKARLTQAVLLH